jgi:chemotaxis protein MotB
MIEFEEDPPPKGAPAWMATFADLMSLLVVFFVLLLSFSEMDVIRYKQLAESMKDAFGVQRELPLEQIPMGTSIIAQNFSPGRTDPTPLEQIQQITADPTKPDLEVGKRDASDSAVEDEAVLEAIQQRIMELDTQTRRDAEKLNETLAAEVQAGAVDIETNMTSITIRIRENGSFPSGSATLNEDFLPVMARLREALAGIGGKISVEGHTDNVPIGGGRFLSN